jgi:hypothetical protein
MPYFERILRLACRSRQQTAAFAVTFLQAIECIGANNTRKQRAKTRTDPFQNRSLVRFRPSHPGFGADASRSYAGGTTATVSESVSDKKDLTYLRKNEKLEKTAPASRLRV